MIILVAAMGALATFFFVLFIIFFLRRSWSMDIFRRLRRHYDATDKKINQSEDIIQQVHEFIERTARPLAELDLAKRLDFMLKQAGVPLLGSEFIIIARPSCSLKKPTSLL